MTITETRPDHHAALLHDLRHLSGRTPHEVIQIGDIAADEIIGLRRISEAVEAVSRSHNHSTEIDDIMLLVGTRTVAA